MVIFFNIFQLICCLFFENYLENGTFEWHDSTLVKCIQNGDWVLIKNANFLNPAVLDRLNSLMEPGGYLSINEKGSIDGKISIIYPHKNFRLFLTMNPQYGELSRAMRNRGIEIVFFDSLDLNQLNNVASLHGVKFLKDFTEYSSFFDCLHESIAKNQHGFNIEEIVLYDETDGDSLLSLINLNELTCDPNAYQAMKDFCLLDFKSFDITKTRLFLENTSDFNIRNQILNTNQIKNFDKSVVKDLIIELSKFRTKLIKTVNCDEDQFKLINILPVDFRENQYLFSYIERKLNISHKWNQNLNNLYLRLLWADLKYRLKTMSNERSFFSLTHMTDIATSKQLFCSKQLMTIKKHLNLIYEKLNSFVECVTPQDNELLVFRNVLITFLKFFSICANFVDIDFKEFLNEQFFPIWFYLIEYKCFDIFTDNSKLISTINTDLNLKLSKFDEKKLEFIANIQKNYFNFKSSDDIKIYETVHDFLQQLTYIGNDLEESNLPKINSVTQKLVDLMSKYFQKQLDFQYCHQELLSCENNLKKIQSLEKYNRTADEYSVLESSQYYILSKLLFSLQILDNYVLKKQFKIDSTENLFLDPYQKLFIQIFNEGAYTDLFVKNLFQLNQEFTIDSVIGFICPKNNFESSNVFLAGISDKNLKNLTIELMPLVSVIYFNIFDNDNVSIEVFYKRQKTKNFYAKNLIENYYCLKNENYPLLNRYIGLAQLLETGYKQFSENNISLIEDILKDDKISSEMNSKTKEEELFEQCLFLIQTGYSFILYTFPDYPIDPNSRTKIELENFQLQTFLLEEELNLRHNLYQQLYNHHDENFHYHIFKLLKSQLSYFQENISKLKNKLIYRKNPSNYFKLATKIDQFLYNQFNWNSLKLLLIEIKKIMTEPYSKNIDSTIAQCLFTIKIINDFLAELSVQYFDYHDITLPFSIGLFFVSKGLQLLAYRIQSFANDNILFKELNAKTIRQLFLQFSEFVSVETPAEICSFAFNNNVLQIITNLFHQLNLDSKIIIVKILKMAFLEIKNSMYVNDDYKKILSLYFQAIDLFVKEWQKIELEQDLAEMKMNALFHIKLEDEEDESKKIEQVFPSFENHFEDLIENKYNFEDKNPLNSVDIKMGVSKDTLLFIARSHIKIISLLEKNSEIDYSDMDFMRSYLIRYEIISKIFKKTFGFISIEVEKILIDGHLLAIVDDYFHQNNSSNANENSKSFNIYHSSILSQTEKCCIVLEKLRKKIINDLLPEFENHPTLIKLLQIIKRIFEIKANASLLCIGSGLEFILKTSEDWQLIAHRGISLIDYLKEITELLVSWRKMEINYWLECLATVSNKIEEKELLIWWPRLYTTINDLVKESNKEKVKEFIQNIKKFLEHSTLGQFCFRLKLIKVFIYYLRYSNVKFIYIENALENIYHFYQHFLPLIVKTIEEEKCSVQKEIKEFVTISKWNPNNFWSLKDSLTKSKKQLFGYIKKYEQSLAKSSNQYFQFEKCLSKDHWKISTEISKHFIMDFEKLKISLKNTGNLFQFELSKADLFAKRSQTITSKIKNSICFHVDNINRLEELNNELIDGINKYSNLNVKENAGAEARKKSIAQIQNQKRRALSDLFKQLFRMGLSFRKGNVHFNEIDLDKTIYTIKTLNETNLEQFPGSDVKSCNTYYYKCLSGYSKFIFSLEKPNSQLTIDMIDRIRGYVVHLIDLVINQRKAISENLENYNELNKKLFHINDSHQLEDIAIINDNSDLIKNNVVRFNQLLKKFLCFIIRLKINISSIINATSITKSDNSPEAFKNVEQLEIIIKNIRNIMQQFTLNRFLFYTDSSLKKFKTFIEKFNKQIELVYNLIATNSSTFNSNIKNLEFFQCESGQILDEINIKLMDLFKNVSTNNDSVSNDFLTKSNVLFKKILFSFECLFKNTKTEKNNESEFNLINDLLLIELLNLFSGNQINLLIDEFIKNISIISESEFSKKRLNILNILTPFLESYINLYQHVLKVSFGVLKTLSKLLHILLTLFNELLLNGFCLPPDLEKDSQNGEQLKNNENSGFGEGNISSDAKDVSERLECQDQLDDLVDCTNKDQLDNKITENHENGIEMDDDFDGEFDDDKIDESKPKEEDIESNENEENMDLPDQMGNVGDDEDILDEKIWSDDSEQEETKSLNNENDRLSGGKEDFDTRMVANKDNNELTAEQDNIEEVNNDFEPELLDENTDKINKDFNENEMSNSDQKEIENEMVLPDNLQLEIDSNNDDENLNENLDDIQDADNVDSDLNDDKEKKDETEALLQDNEMNDQTMDNCETLGNQQENLNETTISNTTSMDINDKANIYSNTNASGHCNEDCQNEENNSDIIGSLSQVSKSNVLDNQQITQAAESASDMNEQIDYSISRSKKNRLIAEDEIKSKRQKIMNTEQMEQNINSDLLNDGNLARHVENKNNANDFAYDLADLSEKQTKYSNDFEHEINVDSENRKKSMEEMFDEQINQAYNSNNKDNGMDNLNNSNCEKMEIDETKEPIKEIVLTSTVNRPHDSTYHFNILTDQLAQKSQDAIENIIPVDIESDANINNKIINEIEGKIEPLVYELCGQLQLVLEPTKRAKYKGDFKNGKRLNMRKVITYVASQFRKDKIWLRRTKPSKRQYQIIIAVDDSMSMSDNQSRITALQSLILLGKSLSIIESGLLSVVSFGEHIQVVHPFGEPFTDQTAIKMLNKVNYHNLLLRN